MSLKPLKEKLRFNCSRFIILIVSITLSVSCGFHGSKVAKNFLEIYYQLDRQKGTVPSYQTVIWLEDESGNYIKSLLVSEWLSYEGYGNPAVCPDWSRVSDWKNTPKKEVDAVTTATPRIGKNVLTIDCKKANLLPGVYHYCIQTHIIENYNVLYCGQIEIGGQEIENIAESTYTPSKHRAAGQILRNVKARYYR